MPDPRPVIFTVSVNYDRAGLTPFVDSWRKHAPETELVIFCSGMRTETLQWLTDNGATVVLSELNLFPGGQGWRLALYHKLCAWSIRGVTNLLHYLSNGKDDRYTRLRMAATNLIVQRYFLAHRHLQTYAANYSHVLLIDCRDAVFQRSPFPCSGLQVFAENELIGASHFCKRWLQLTYGTGAWRRLAANPHLCSGVTLGDSASVQAYLDVMCAEAIRLVACTSGVDQALHNYIIHQGMVAATVNKFGEGAAINLNAAPLTSLDIREGRMYALDGTLFAIVHQYDRVPGLQLKT